MKLKKLIQLCISALLVVMGLIGLYLGIEYSFLVLALGLLAALGVI